VNEALVKLAQGDFNAFVDACKTDPGLPRGPAALGVINTLSEEAYERLRARLKDETKVRVRELDRALKDMRAMNGAGHDDGNSDADVATALPVSDFIAHSPDHTYIHRFTREVWSATAVNARVKPIDDGSGKKATSASTWLDRNDAVEQKVWAPGEPEIIENRMVSEGGFFIKKGARVYNLYKAPVVARAADDDIGFWQNHLCELWPDEAEHIELFFAHRVQRPGEKINHALVLGGAPGIGKDAILYPLRHAVGPWNFADVSPQAILGTFNEFVQSVVLRISEIKDLGGTDKHKFYEATKTLFAAPPDTLRCNPKHIRPYYVLNVTSAVITTNHKASGLYLPRDDRRHNVSWSTVEEGTYAPAYWGAYWKRMINGGADAVAAHLRSLSLKGFDAKAPPVHTQAFLEIVDAHCSANEANMADVIESLGNPKILRVIDLISRAGTLELVRFVEFLRDPGNGRAVTFLIEECGYRRLANRADKRSGRWVIGSWRGSVYVPQNLSDREGFEAITEAGGVGWIG
jgi:hypothetical protein